MRNQSGRRLPNFAVGLIMMAVLAVMSYVAFTKNVPWGGGTEYTVVFNSAQNLRSNSPVRIAGVEVGKVTDVQPLDQGATDEGQAASGSVQTGAVVKMEINDEGLPLKEDSTFTLRPRLFLEGNLFVDVKPGSPGAPAADSDFTFQPQQTANSVQLDQVLTGVFQADTRSDLRVFFDQFGSALVDEGGAKSLKVLNRASPSAFRFTSEVNQAVLGQNPHDLSELIGNLNKVVRALDADEPALQDLITNLRITTGSFAAQSVPLEQALQELPRTLAAGNTAFASLNASFPATRAFAREALPGTRSAPATLDAATPLLKQLRLLSRPQELRGLVSDLRPTVPNLALLTRRTIPFLEQTRTLSSCFNNVIIPWANDSVTSSDPEYQADHPAEGAVYEETGYGLAGIAGESRSGDSNGEYIRVIAGGGSNTVQTSTGSGSPVAGITPLPLEGSMPALEDSAKTPFKPDVPCETQEPPDLTAAGGAAPQQSTMSAPSSRALPEDAQAAMDAVNEAAALSQKYPDRPETKQSVKDAIKSLEDILGKYGA